jgi:hypothetical protein
MKRYERKKDKRQRVYPYLLVLIGAKLKSKKPKTIYSANSPTDILISKNWYNIVTKNNATKIINTLCIPAIYFFSLSDRTHLSRVSTESQPQAKLGSPIVDCKVVPPESEALSQKYYSRDVQNTTQTLKCYKYVSVKPLQKSLSIILS